MIRNSLILLVLFYLYTFFVYSQKIDVSYSPINYTIFAENNYPIKIALLEFKDYVGGENLNEKIYLELKKDPNIVSKFSIYPLNSMQLWLKSTKFESLNPSDETLLKKISDELSISYIVFGENTADGLKVIIKNTRNNNIMFSGIFINSDSSTALQDFQKLLSDNLFARYEKRGTLTVNVTPKNFDFTINLEPQLNTENISLKPGKYIIEIRKEGYYPIKEQVLIEPEKDIIKNYTLIPAYGRLTLKVSPPYASVKIKSLADSTINYEWIGNANSIIVRAGLYEAIFSAVGFATSNRKFLVNIEEHFEENVNLIRDFFTIDEVLFNDPKIYNVSISQGKYEYKIKFNLAGKPDSKYDINLYVFRKSNPEDLFPLKGLKGDIGKGVKVGFNKLIIWQVEKDFPTNINSGDFIFYMELD